MTTEPIFHDCAPAVTCLDCPLEQFTSPAENSLNSAPAHNAESFGFQLQQQQGSLCLTFHAQVHLQVERNTR